MTRPGYFVVSPSMFAYAEEFGLATASQCLTFVATMNRAPGWRILYSRGRDDIRTGCWPLSLACPDRNDRSERRVRMCVSRPTTMRRSGLPNVCTRRCESGLGHALGCTSSSLISGSIRHREAQRSGLSQRLQTCCGVGQLTSPLSQASGP